MQLRGRMKQDLPSDALGAIQLDASNVLIVQGRGRSRIQVRRWWRPTKEKLRPTRTGIAVPRWALRRLASILTRAADDAEAIVR